MWQLEHDCRDMPFANTLSLYSAKVRSRCTPAGVTMSWQPPHIAELFSLVSLNRSENSARCTRGCFGFAIGPRIVTSLASFTGLLLVGCCSSSPLAL